MYILLKNQDQFKTHENIKFNLTKTKIQDITDK